MQVSVESLSSGSRFFTGSASIINGKPQVFIHQWQVVCPEHRVAVLVVLDNTIDHTRIIETNDFTFDNEADAWEFASRELDKYAQSIHSLIQDCESKAQSLKEAA